MQTWFNSPFLSLLARASVPELCSPTELSFSSLLSHSTSGISSSFTAPVRAPLTTGPQLQGRTLLLSAPPPRKHNLVQMCNTAHKNSGRDLTVSLFAI